MDSLRLTMEGGRHLTRQCDLQDLLAKETIDDGVSIVLDHVSVEDAHRLATALASLAVRVDVPHFSLWITFSSSSAASAQIVADSLHVFQGLKDAALVFSQTPGSPSASKMAGVTIRSLQNSSKNPKRTSQGDSSKTLQDLLPENGVETLPKILPLDRAPRKSQPASLLDLPREIRHVIIDHVINDDHGQFATLLPEEPEAWEKCCDACLPMGLRGGNSLCACPRLVSGDSTTCKCHTKRLALLSVNKTLYADSSYMFLSRNRLRLRNLTKTLQFLSRTPDDLLHAIRTLDIKISYSEYKLFFDQSPEIFEQIITIIASKCNVPRLYLSIDSAGDDTELDIWPQEDLHLIEQMRSNITNTLKPLGGLDRLDIYLSSAKPEDEERMEKQVMGDDYDALARGKLHMSLRDPLSVHERWESVECWVDYGGECDLPTTGFFD